MDHPFENIQEISRYLNIKVGTIYAMVEGGKIPYYRVGRLVRFKRSEIDLWMEGNRKECVDPAKAGREALRSSKGADLDVSRIVRKAIDEGKRKRYTTPRGKPDQVKGLGKGVLNGTL